MPRTSQRERKVTIRTMQKKSVQLAIYTAKEKRKYDSAKKIGVMP